MNTLSNILAALLLTILLTQTLLATPEIKLTGRKDLVLSVDSRTLVLDVARLHLSEKSESDAFLDVAANAESPYAFEQPVVAIVRNGQGELDPVEETVINYDDASVLSVVAKSFSKQVRGTLARGSTSFLQLTGGNMIKPGTSFPVSLPQAQGQTFTVTVSEIFSDSYTLMLGEATETVSLNERSTGAIKRD